MTKKVGIVLAGGGAKGAFQIGVLKVLRQYMKANDQELVAVSGTSIGAFNGAFLASNQFDLLEQMWMEFDTDNCPLTRTGMFGVVGTMLTKGYAYHPEPLKRFIKKNLNFKSFIESKITYVNTKVCLTNGEMVLGGNRGRNAALGKDIICKEIMASMAAIPFTPSVNIDGHEYADGGFKDAVPVEALINAVPNLDKIYIIECNKQKRSWKPEISVNSPRTLFAKICFVFDEVMWEECNRSDIEIGKLKYWGNDDKFTLISPAKVDLRATDFDVDSISEQLNHGISLARSIFTK
jgi:predicted acylesterase/phospholipase RssA